MQEVIAITSGKGGVGKSTFASTLGLTAAQLGKRVCLIDMDMGLRSLDILLRVQDKVVFDLADVAEGMCRIKQALVKHESFDNLFLLSAAQNRGSEAVSQMQLKRVLSQLRERFDLIVLDCPAGIGRGFRNAVSTCDRAVLVSVPGAVELRDAERVRGLIRHASLPEADLVLNRVTYKDMADEESGVPAFRNRLEGMRLIGLVPEDKALAPDGEARKALSVAAQNLLGEEIPLKEIVRPGLFTRVLQAIRG